LEKLLFAFAVDDNDRTSAGDILLGNRTPTALTFPHRSGRSIWTASSEVGLTNKTASHSSVSNQDSVSGGRLGKVFPVRTGVIAGAVRGHCSSRRNWRVAK